MKAGEEEWQSALDAPFESVGRDAKDVLAIICLLGVTLIINNFLEKRNVPVPQAISTMVVGAMGGGLASLLPRINRGTIFNFEKNAANEFMLVFIAPIIFAEGYGIQRREFFDNIARILAYAFVGTIISTVVVALVVFYLPPLTGLAEPYQDLTLAECLTFGAMISSTDPVTTLGIFKEQRLAEIGLGHLYYSVLGESIMNDAVAITLFDSFSSLVEDGQEMDLNMLAHISGSFCYKFAMSVVVGVAVGIAAALVLKFARLGSGGCESEHGNFNVPELGVMLVFAYLPFLIAETLELSGIVAIMFGGITMKSYAHYNLTAVTRQVFLPTVELMANLLETYVFLLLGLAVFLLPHAYSGPVILWSALGCLIGRACNVYPLGVLVNTCSCGPSFTLRQQHVVWFAGLRGAMAFMCALNFPLSPNKKNDHRQLFLCTTMIIAVATIVCLGWPTTTLLRCLGIVKADAEMEEGGEEAADGQLLQHSGPAASGRVCCFGRAQGESPGRLSLIAERSAAMVRKALMTSDAVMLRAASLAPSSRPSLGLFPAWLPAEGASHGIQWSGFAAGVPPMQPGRTSAPAGGAAGLLAGAADDSSLQPAALPARPSLPPRLHTPGAPGVPLRPPRRSMRMIVDP